MPHAFQLNVCANGNAMDPKNWSGTPRHICDALIERNQLGKVIDPTPPKSLKILLSLLSVPLYGTFEIARGPIRRRWAARKAERLTEESPTKMTLHTHSLALPFAHVPAGQQHFLYSDTSWGLWSKLGADISRCSPRLIKAAEQLERKAYAQFNHIFAISENFRNDLVENYAVPVEKITVCGTGRGTIEPFFGEKDYSTCRILFTAKGRFKDKGGEELLHAFREARKLNPNISLTVVGHSDYAQMPAEEGLKVLGFISKSELQKLFETHNLFVMPASNEPWGLVYLEAMACRMPVIGLNLNAFPEICGQGRFGKILADGRNETLVRTLVEVSSSPDWLKETGFVAQSFCLEHYTWERTVDRIMSKIEALQKGSV